MSDDPPDVSKDPPVPLCELSYGGLSLGKCRIISVRKGKSPHDGWEQFTVTVEVEKDVTP